MNSSELPRIRVDPASETSRRLIREELASLLQSVHFMSSKRYPALLKYVVEKTLDGRSDELKERVLGIEVFGRTPDYDTNNDTIVRVTAGEVRKRLTLIYHESANDRAVQIQLPVGSYVPEFLGLARLDDPTPVLSPVETMILVSGDPTQQHEFAPSAIHLPTSRSGSWRRLWNGLALVLLGAALATFFLHVRSLPRKNSVDRFWAPVHASSSPVILCAGALSPSSSDQTGFTEADKKDDYPYVSVVTAGVLTGLANVFAKDGTDYFLQPASSTTLTDMRLHPTVLIGAYNNKWSVLLLNDLRFRFAAKPSSQIYDASNPAKIWSRPESLPYKDKDDYAIVARFHDSLTDNLIVVIAGLGKNGTEAAAQFVTTPRYLDLLYQQQRFDGLAGNMEIVLKTTVVDSKTGAPSIEAFYAW